MGGEGGGGERELAGGRTRVFYKCPYLHSSKQYSRGHCSSGNMDYQLMIHTHCVGIQY